jgi:hypothetical protein
MKKLSKNVFILLVFSILVSSFIFTSCKKTENPIKYPKGIFPDTTLIMSDINSSFDDFNTSLFHLYGNISIIFSSNRGSSGGQFDLVQGLLSFTFDQTNADFELGVEIYDDAFLTKLINTANTTRDDLGPYQLFSTVDGFEYLLLSSVNGSGNLDFYFLKNIPVFGNNLPDVFGPSAIKLLNTNYDDAYISLDANQDTAYFSSNVEGNFEIFLISKPLETPLDAWFNSDYSAGAKVDSINSASEDKCPFVFRKAMVFASNRSGGLGGYDLYYSIFRNGKWSSPVNFGPDVNTSSDEFRPVLGTAPDYKNYFMIFSSNRPGGQGGYDLYFRGVTFSK